MAKDKQRVDISKYEEDHRETDRKDAGAGRSHNSGVDGIGGVGGSSGTGSVRAKAREVGDISGIDAELDPNEVPPPGSTGKAGPSQARQRQSSDGGLSGKTRGEDSETVPNQEPAGHPDSY